MCKSEDRTTANSQGTSIAGAFSRRESNRFYRYYHANDGSLINRWDQLLDCYYKDLIGAGVSKWLFRGDVLVESTRSMENSFKTSLDKAFEEFDTPANTTNGRETLRNKIEKRILRGFRRRAHLLTDGKASTQTHLETLALLRHHGGPARILDWMYSFFPAVYLAINRYDEGDTYTVWSVNREWVRSVSESLEDDFLKNREYLEKHFKGDEERLVYLREYDNNQFQSYVVTYTINQNSGSAIYAATPYRFNERLAAQRATLLFAGTVDKTWGQNLEDRMNESLNSQPPMIAKGKEIQGPILCEIPLRLSKACRNEFLRRLDEMNINQASLFPDLDGFAQSLRTRIAHPESLGIDVGEDE